jgi:hypothetical protein
MRRATRGRPRAMTTSASRDRRDENTRRRCSRKRRAYLGAIDGGVGYHPRSLIASRLQADCLPVGGYAR